MRFQWSTAVVAPITAAALGLGYGLGVHVPNAGLNATAEAASRSVRMAATTTNGTSGSALTATSFENVASASLPAIVEIFANVPGQIQQSPFGEQLGPSASSQGSGFFVSSDGLIVTNDHVIAGASSISVRVYGYTQRFKATVVGTDYARDLALLKITPPKAMATLTLATGPSADPVGAWTVAIGSPEGLYDTVTTGIVSAKGRSFSIGGRSYSNLIQTSSAISPGNSGGPLLDLAGQVIGINTAVNASGQNLGFAIPAQTVATAVTTMQKQHTTGQGWLGVIVTTNSAQVASQDNLSVKTGVLVVAVDAASPASQAGFQAGDVIISANGKTVTSATGLTQIIESTHPGDTMHFTVVRGTRRLSLTAVLQTRPTNAA